MRAGWILLLLLWPVHELSAAAPTAEPAQRIEWKEYLSRFDAYVRDHHIVGASTVLVRDGRVVQGRDVGLADRELGQPIDENTLFHYASITKTLTAITIMQLHERGRLSLEDAVTRYLPELHRIHNPYGSPDQITVRMLLNHSSGLQNPTWPWAKGEPWEPFEPTTWEQLVAMLPYQKLAFAPGTRFSYSNPAYIYLARIVEVVTGEPWLAYVQKNVFAPLGMDRSYFSSTPYYLSAYRSNNYFVRPGNGGFETQANGRDFDPGITNPNGGWNAPLGDVVKYIAFLTHATNGDTRRERLFETVLKRTTLQTMWQAALPTSQNEAEAKTAEARAGDYMGLSFYVLPRGGTTLVGHTGGQNGFLSFLYFSPSTRTGIVTMFNTTSYLPGSGGGFFAVRDAALGVLQ